MKKSILTIIPSLYGGGAEKVTADLSYSLSNHFNHTIITYNKKKSLFPFAGNMMELNVPVKNGVLGRIVRQIKIYRELLDVKKSSSPSVTISHMLMANMLNVLTKKKDKTLCFIHGEWSIKTGKSKMLDWLVKKQYEKADMIVSVSHHIKNMFVTYYAIDVPHKVIHIGVHVDDILQKAEESISIHLPHKYMVYVAGFRPVKNHILLLNQLETYLKSTDISLVLVGDGELRPQIDNKIKALGLEDKVILAGNQSNPYPIIKKAFLSLLFSSSESFSLVILESMVMGVPVIATDCGGPREILDRQWENKRPTPLTTKDGILIGAPNGNSHHELIDAIKILSSNPDLYNSISESSQRRAQVFNITNTELKLMEIINELEN